MEFENESSDKDEYDSENQIYKFDEYVDILWEEIMLPYIENIYAKNILTKLDKFDKHKFYNYIMSNCSVAKELFSHERA